MIDTWTNKLMTKPAFWFLQIWSWPLYDLDCPCQIIFNIKKVDCGPGLLWLLLSINIFIFLLHSWPEIQGHSDNLFTFCWRCYCISIIDSDERMFGQESIYMYNIFVACMIFFHQFWNCQIGRLNKIAYSQRCNHKCRIIE